MKDEGCRACRQAGRMKEVSDELGKIAECGFKERS